MANPMVLVTLQSDESKVNLFIKCANFKNKIILFGKIEILFINLTFNFSFFDFVPLR